MFKFYPIVRTKVKSALKGFTLKKFLMYKNDRSQLITLGPQKFPAFKDSRKTAWPIKII